MRPVGCGERRSGGQLSPDAESRWTLATSAPSVVLMTPDPLVDIVRSRRRRRTVSAYRDGDRTVVLMPAGMPPAEEQRWVKDMISRLERREARLRGRTPAGDSELSV